MARRAVLFVVVLLSLGTFSGVVRQDSTPSYNPRDYSTGVFEGCPPEGRGGDAYLNTLKNRDVPPVACKFVAINELCVFKSDIVSQMGAKERQNWTVAARSEIAMMERLGVVTEGFLIAATQMGVESCNCGDKTKRDYHLTIGSSDMSRKSESMIAEVSPRTLKLHPSWDLKVLKRLAKQKSLVRISGWAMWDSEHGSLIGKTRATLLEIHPIHKIEVKVGGKWREL